jgi:hypothetical protein
MTGASPGDGFEGELAEKVWSGKTLTFGGILGKTGEKTWCIDG